MLPQYYRLTTKDVRYIQKQRNLIRTQHFWFLYIPQYRNKSYHQASIYIAADTVKKATRRHALKRQLLEHLQSQLLPKQWTRQKYYKLFVFLNKKNVTAWQWWTNKSDRERIITHLRTAFIKERHIANQKLAL